MKSVSPDFCKVAVIACNGVVFANHSFCFENLVHHLVNFFEEQVC